jgi:beta-N-acetylhexosaminidase
MRDPLTAQVTVRSYRDADRLIVGALWHAALGREWPLPERAFDAITAGAGALVAEHAGVVVGYVAVRVVKRHASVLVIFVHPAFARRGIGSTLLQAALSAAGRARATQLSLGCGAGAYFWPGVPENLPGAGAFFDAHRWPRDWVAADLIGDIRDFTTPPSLMARAAETAVSFRLCQLADADAVLNFQALHFPQWTDAYRRQLERAGGVLVGVMTDGRLVATCTLDSGDDYRFAALIDGQVGAFGAVGVDPDARGQGIGLALCARASELLAERGNEYCFVGYTHLAGWYAQLGYETWRTYRMSARSVDSPRTLTCSYRQPPVRIAATGGVELRQAL